MSGGIRRIYPRSYVGETFSVAMIAAALSIPAAWKELRSRRLDEQERAARADADEGRIRLERVVNSTYGAIVESDESGRIVLAQGPLVNSFGFDEGDLIGRRQLGLIVPSHRRTWGLKTPDRSGGLTGEVRVFDAEQRERWVSFSTTMLIDSNSHPRFITAIRDIEKEIASRHQMQEVERLESLSTICAGLAHDFNNVLTVFGVLCEKFDDAQLRSELMSAQTQASELTEGLLSFAKQRETVDRPILIDEFVQEIRPIVERIAGAKVETRWRVDCPGAVIVMEHLSLQQIFFNLVMNARHAMAHGGRIDIR
ncbi:MAG: PAS domain S-box protein, partial [Planctomycetota bacterium]